ncbi:MAG: class I SAM-dependent methyltransferase [Candidatus Thorarchaeota archaeon]
MASKARAWKELLKIGLNVSKLRTQINSFFRGNIIRVLRDEGWFEYLSQPRTADEILSHFGYTDSAFLAYLLDILVEDKTLIHEDGIRYRVNGHVEDGWTLPACFDGTMQELWEDHARAIPNRLRGEYIKFTGGMNLFNWDDALSNHMYEQIRRSAFAYTGAWDRPGAFLDVGAGTGYGTAAIWAYYFKKGHMKDGSPIRIVGIEPNDRLLTIAKEEFPSMVRRHLGEQADFTEALQQFPPEFKNGYAESIPFDDETFDYVYASQVLHWTQPKTALREMFRVTKPGGYVFGTENFFPDANKFGEIHFKVVKGAFGHFHRDDLRQWAKELGAKEVRIATPISVFQILK